MLYLKDAAIALLETDKDNLLAMKQKFEGVGSISCFRNPFQLYNYALQNKIDIVVTSKSMDSASGISLMNTLRKTNTDQIFVFILPEITDVISKYAFKEKVSEVFDWSFTSESIQLRLNYLLERRCKGKEGGKKNFSKQRRIPLYKRVFDICFSSILLIIILPLLLLLAVLIKIESKGPVIYYSSRVGTGYRIFKFYKFRSMRLNADQQLKNITHLNQYNQSAQTTISDEHAKCDFCAKQNIACKAKLYADGKEYCENIYQLDEAQSQDSTFIKIKDDPRVTRIGRFIRNTSLDELPQLFNVLIGDMSIVGNRPLPLYEAEKLTTDQFSERFYAPAGITGLWQISKRGKGDMTEEERIALDNQYARTFSLWLDLQILFRTFFALLQKENV